MTAPTLDTERNFYKAIDTENKYSGSIMAALIETAPKNLTKVRVRRCCPYKNITEKHCSVVPEFYSFRNDISEI